MEKIIVLVLILILSLSLVACDAKASSSLISAAKYPEMPNYPDESKFEGKNGDFDAEGFDKLYNAWSESIADLDNVPEGYDHSIKEFSKKTVSLILKGDENENHVYSPANVYIALSMLADISQGNSQKEILELISTKDIEDTREKAKSVWNVLYRNDGATTSILANSIWLNEELGFRKEGLSALAENYFASSYQGEMGSKQYNKELQNWINEQTGGLLEDQVLGLEMDPKTILALVSTIYYKDKWEDTFSENDNIKEVFHSSSGDSQVEYMTQSSNGVYYFGDKFSAIIQDFESGNEMWFILPDEGYHPNDILKDENLLNMLFSKGNWKDSKRVMIHKTIPKFDVVSNKDLVESFKELGIQDVFNSNTSDFSPILDGSSNAYISQIEHAARVMIDEEGCEAAAYTVMMEATSAMPPNDEVNFILNRPFVFAITGRDGIPLFMGVVNRCGE